MEVDVLLKIVLGVIFISLVVSGLAYRSGAKLEMLIKPTVGVLLLLTIFVILFTLNEGKL